MSLGDKRFTAVVMAGSRAAGDPLALASGVAHKAFVPVGGVPMLARVLATLRAARNVGRIVVVGLDPELVQVEPALQAAIGSDAELIRGGTTPATSAALAIETLGLAPPVLITTADHPLLTTAMVEQFCDASCASDGDVSFGVTGADAVTAAFPGIRRTNWHFRDGSYCGCNLYGLLTVPGCRAPTVWKRVEQFRKQPWRIIGMLGAGALLRFALGRLALADITPLLQARIGLRGAAIHLSDAAAGFDVDTIPQRAAAERYLQRGM